ncbi:MAG: hypothetical protein QM820_00685 [Minicystis sp.]
MRRRHAARTPLLGLLAVSAILSLSACGGSSADRTVKDEAGRTCSIPESGSLTISCDAAPAPSTACTGSAAACFVTGTVGNTTSMIGPAAVCAACCDGNQSSSVEADCSPIVCETLDDCPLGTTECKDKGCY